MLGERISGLLFPLKLYFKIFNFSLAPNLTVVVEPPEISGNASDEAINLTCSAKILENITPIQYQLIWLFHGAPIDNQPGAQNMVMMCCLYNYMHIIM